MKKLYIVVFSLLLSVAAIAQTYTPEEAAKHIGDSISVCGKIFGGRFFETSKSSPTLLNMGAAFPASTFTVMIPGDVRLKLGYIPEQELKDKIICVRGKVILYKERPEIIVYNPAQIQIQN
ncbi:MAG: hypothetical protein WKF88_07715 [Ferruginibacter sp.]